MTRYTGVSRSSNGQLVCTCNQRAKLLRSRGRLCDENCRIPNCDRFSPGHTGWDKAAALHRCALVAPRMHATSVCTYIYTVYMHKHTRQLCAHARETESSTQAGLVWWGGGRDGEEGGSQGRSASAQQDGGGGEGARGCRAGEERESYL